MNASFKRFDEIEIDDKPLIHIISDSLGATATSVVMAAAGQFEDDIVDIERLSKVDKISQVREYLDLHANPARPMAVFHTIVDSSLRNEVRSELDYRGIPSIDLIGPAITVLSTLTGAEPKNIPGVIHNTDERYFRRVAAMEFFVEHDDGRNARDLDKADVVLVGVSRTSKTPLSMYLAFLGYKVANVPLAMGVEPPAELFEVDPRRIFGLISTTNTLTEIRQKRLSDDAAFAVAGSYASPEEIDVEQQEARQIMRKLGCLTIRTNGRAVEETAAEIIEHINDI